MSTDATFMEKVSPEKAGTACLRQSISAALDFVKICIFARLEPWRQPPTAGETGSPGGVHRRKRSWRNVIGEKEV